MHGYCDTHINVKILLKYVPQYSYLLSWVSHLVSVRLKQKSASQTGCQHGHVMHWNALRGALWGQRSTVLISFHLSIIICCV